jgi:hypothetical protein
MKHCVQYHQIHTTTKVGYWVIKHLVRFQEIYKTTKEVYWVYPSYYYLLVLANALFLFYTLYDIKSDIKKAYLLTYIFIRLSICLTI